MVGVLFGAFAKATMNVIDLAHCLARSGMGGGMMFEDGSELTINELSSVNMVAGDRGGVLVQTSEASLSP